MAQQQKSRIGRKRLLKTMLLGCAGLALGLPVRAQDDSGYRNDEAGRHSPARDASSAIALDENRDDAWQGDASGRNGNSENGDNQGPVRLARIAYVKGNVTWRPDPDADWTRASVNVPLRQGAELWVTDGGRAEIQFDDGSVLRLGNGALVTLQTFYSDADGEFTEIKALEGLVSLRLKHERSVYQIDTPLASVKAVGPAKVRVGVSEGVEVAVRQGRATIEGANGKTDLQNGDYLDLRDENDRYEPRAPPRPDSWDRWTQERDDRLDGVSERIRKDVPANVSIMCDDLDEYGNWRDDSRYGRVWVPRVTAQDWRPYQYGHWTWVNPFGWTWVSEEPWGWAPYHYGTWIRQPYGWAWVPGPVNQYWSPAVVHFSEYEGQVAWCPLAPVEVRYPSALSIGFRHGNWSAFFSIGGCGVYYPNYSNVCYARPFRNTYVNHVTYIRNVTNVTNVYNGVPANRSAWDRFGNSSEYYAHNRGTYLENSRFVPFNARTTSGVTVANVQDFGGRGAYRPAVQGGSAFFARGRAIAAPPVGAAPVAGPLAARPNRMALSPTRTAVRETTPAPRVLDRTVYRTPVAAHIERASGSFIGPTRNPSPVADSLNRSRQGANNDSGTARAESRTPASRGSRPTGTGTDTTNGRTAESNGSSGRFGRGSESTNSASSSGGTRTGEAGTGRRDRSPDPYRPTYTPGSGRDSSGRDSGSAAESARRARESLNLPSRSRSRDGSGTGDNGSGNATPPRNGGGERPSSGGGAGNSGSERPSYNGGGRGRSETSGDSPRTSTDPSRRRDTSGSSGRESGGGDNGAFGRSRRSSEGRDTPPPSRSETPRYTPPASRPDRSETSRSQPRDEPRRERSSEPPRREEPRPERRSDSSDKSDKKDSGGGRDSGGGGGRGRSRG